MKNKKALTRQMVTLIAINVSMVVVIVTIFLLASSDGNPPGLPESSGGLLENPSTTGLNDLEKGPSINEIIKNNRAGGGTSGGSSGGGSGGGAGSSGSPSGGTPSGGGDGTVVTTSTQWGNRPIESGNIVDGAPPSLPSEGLATLGIGIWLIIIFIVMADVIITLMVLRSRKKK
jgi:hypothetical protein